MRTGLIAGIAVLAVVLIFIIQNADAVSISFLGAHLHLSLAVALLLAAVAGALIMAAAGTARITQLRQTMRRDRRKADARQAARLNTAGAAPDSTQPGAPGQARAGRQA